MKKLIQILLVIIVLTINTGSFAANSTISSKYNIFYGEIEKRGAIDLGTRFFIYDINKKKRTEIKNTYLNEGSGGMPVPSRDLRFFTYFTEIGENQYLNVLDMDKNKIVKKVKVPLLSREAALSRNLQYITFCRDGIEGEDKREIYFYDNKLGKLKQITINDFPDFNSVFSPDAGFILYLSEPNLNKTILKKYSIIEATTESVKTFNGTGYVLNQWAENGIVLMINHNNGIPFWLDLITDQTKDISLSRIHFIKASPDGKMLMYLQERKNNDSEWNLFVSDIDGKNPQMITKPDNVDIFGVEWVNGK
jgi:tricorn protease-like protein